MCTAGKGKEGIWAGKDTLNDFYFEIIWIFKSLQKY